MNNKTVKLNITITPLERLKARRNSIKVFGRHNVSGYIRHLINKEKDYKYSRNIK